MFERFKTFVLTGIATRVYTHAGVTVAMALPAPMVLGAVVVESVPLTDEQADELVRLGAEDARCRR